jgi:hypothetical protein
VVVRHILIGARCTFALGLAAVAVAHPQEMAAVALIPLLLVGAIVLALTARSCWVIVPSVVLIVLGAALAGAMVLGNIAWPRSVTTALVVSLPVLFAVEVAVIVLATAGFRRESVP